MLMFHPVSLSQTEPVNSADVGKRVNYYSSRDKKKKCGTLLYFGGLESASGVWCGIELDKPEGKNNGTKPSMCCMINYGRPKFASGVCLSFRKLAVVWQRSPVPTSAKGCCFSPAKSKRTNLELCSTLGAQSSPAERP